MNTLTDIPKHKYEGYLWLSNAKDPEVFHGEVIDFNEYESKINPFIIEGLLWCEAEKTSIHLKHTGRYIINKNIVQDTQNDVASYLAHRVSGVKKLKFKQLWLVEKDPLCEDMEVLKMQAQIFIGFES